MTAQPALLTDCRHPPPSALANFSQSCVSPTPNAWLQTHGVKTHISEYLKWRLVQARRSLLRKVLSRARGTPLSEKPATVRGRRPASQARPGQAWLGLAWPSLARPSFAKVLSRLRQTLLFSEASASPAPDARLGAKRSGKKDRVPETKRLVYARHHFLENWLGC